MNTVTYEPSCGETIYETIDAALKLADEKSCLVEFTFNGTKVLVDPKVSMRSPHWLGIWQNVREAQQEAYANSPEAKAAAEKHSKELVEKQAACDALMNKLLGGWCGSIGDELNALMVELIPLTDYSGVVYDKKALASMLVSYGYVRDEYVGYTGEWTADKKQRWVYGQIIDGIESGHGIHPILADKLGECYV
ncbi:coil containing protein [Vibrio phage 3.058.O._10N.286.46.B8]|nr:coil containing protein [Vibrio phage 2.058.O._10N.286.46.B8]AUS03133.1 coil containing protein [Vibrio phage 3.058.O._10N.286.46.B8]